MNLTTIAATDGTGPALWLLEELPGVADLVWSILARVDRERDPVRLVFAAAEPRAGNTVMAAATAVALTRHLRVPVCLIETDVEHPALANYLGLRSAGLSDVLDGRAKLDACLQRVPLCPELYALPAGLPRKPISGEFATPAMQEVLREAAQRGRFIVIDAPPALGRLESRLLLQHADAAVLVLRAGATRIDAAKRAQRMLLEAGTPLLGSVFNAFTGAKERRASQAYEYPRSTETLVDELEAQSFTRPGIEREAP
ncbi:MAG TPA: hypothetical protein VM509_07900, partial [Planctomycetota bacterium]|nr:hypothetical protein [Planctomycetota bacterium]